MSASSDEIAAAFERGVAAYRRGNPPPTQAEEAEGWYFAENVVAHGQSRLDAQAAEERELPEGADFARGCLYSLAAGVLAWAGIIAVIVK